MHGQSHRSEQTQQQTRENSFDFAQEWEALLAWAWSYVDVGQGVRAEVAFIGLAELDPKDARVWAGAAVAAHLQGGKERVGEYLMQLAARRPDASLRRIVERYLGMP